MFTLQASQQKPLLRIPQVSLQSLPCQLRVADMGGNNVMITVPPESMRSIALAVWLVQRLRGMKQVVLGYPKKRSVLVTLPLSVDHGSFSATRQVLSSMTATKVEERFELAIFEMGMFAATEHLTAEEAQLQIDQQTHLSEVPVLNPYCHTLQRSIT